jgi:hypothetical protein
MEHPSCSPDLSQNDFWLFPEIKSALKVWRFQDNEDSPHQKKQQLEFQKCLQHWQYHWVKCIAAQG